MIADFYLTKFWGTSEMKNLDPRNVNCFLWVWQCTGLHTNDTKSWVGGFPPVCSQPGLQGGGGHPGHRGRGEHRPTQHTNTKQGNKSKFVKNAITNYSCFLMTKFREYWTRSSKWCSHAILLGDQSFIVKQTSASLHAIVSPSIFSIHESSFFGFIQQITCSGPTEGPAHSGVDLAAELFVMSNGLK